MNDKYYTPEIEEFHIGFEFESNYVLFSQNSEWKKITLNDSHNWFWQSYDEDAVETEFRVKYLDREDIESAFEKDKHFVCRGNGVGGNDYFINNDKDRMLHNVYTHRCVIEIWDNERKDNYVAFVGIIKNKSELKRIMKMIGI